MLKESYLLWHSFLKHLPRLTQYTLGAKIDNLFTELIALSLTAQYAKREEKLPLLLVLSKLLDNLKYFATILWETKEIDSGKYAQLAHKLAFTGTQVGGWIQKMQALKKETPPN